MRKVPLHVVPALFQSIRDQLSNKLFQMRTRLDGSLSLENKIIVFQVQFIVSHLEQIGIVIIEDQG